MRDDAALFIATQIAAALGKSKRAVLYALKEIPFSTASNGARVWAFATLPSDLQQRLHEQARTRGFRDALALLAASLGTPKARLAYADARESDQQRAVALHRALAPSIARREDRSLTESEFNRLGVEVH